MAVSSVVGTAQAAELHSQRSRIDMLAILRPTVVGIISEVIHEVRSRVVDEQQLLQVWQDRYWDHSMRGASCVHVLWGLH